MDGRERAVMSRRTAPRGSGSVSKPDLPERNPTAAALKFNMRRQTLSAAPSSTSPSLTRKQSSELEGGGSGGGEEGGVYYKDTERAAADKTGGCAPVDIFVIVVTPGQSRKLPESAHTVDFKCEIQARCRHVGLPINYQ